MLKQIDNLKNAISEIKDMSYAHIMEKMMETPVSTFTEMLVFPNPLLEAYKKELFDRYRPMVLNEEDDKRVKDKHYPWSHNPSDLCRVYLPLKDGTQDQYFSNKYLYNGYMSSIFYGSNFEYDSISGESTLKE